MYRDVALGADTHLDISNHRKSIQFTIEKEENDCIPF